uniref:RING-CH-type domain-containing protein n=2 Tax=Aegilops tauschii subsp. strangulata TaxID=200361 RepID=A0A452YT00_AEGTS
PFREGERSRGAAANSRPRRQPEPEPERKAGIREIGGRRMMERQGEAWCSCSPRQCRICHEEEGDDGCATAMESPCGCSGSLKYAHRGCVQRWCDEKGSTVCEICLQVTRPSLLPLHLLEKISLESSRVRLFYLIDHHFLPFYTWEFPFLKNLYSNLHVPLYSFCLIIISYFFIHENSPFYLNI